MDVHHFNVHCIIPVAKIPYLILIIKFVCLFVPKNLANHGTDIVYRLKIKLKTVEVGLPPLSPSLKKI